MYTQCPHCEAIFRVSMKEITTAHGQLRCGECDHTFDAMDSLSSTLPCKLNDTDAHNDTVTTEETIEHPNLTRSWRQAITTTDNNSNHSGATPSQDKAKKYLFLAVSGLVILLLLQTLYSTRHWLAHQPMTANMTRSICKSLGCSITPRRDPTKIKVLSRNVYAHPNEPGSLIITSTMKNLASYKQPLPLIEVSFLDKNDHTIALRRFRPQEYTQKSRMDKKLFTPNEILNFRIKIEDPGSKAVTFQFNFL